MTLAAPFPYFGGKRRAAARIWQALGDPASYVEPFAGSAAVLLARPPFTGRRVETLNDLDGWLVNCWRAIQLSPDAVAAAALGPVAEIDYHARLAWLQERRSPDLVAWLEGDPEHHDARAAGWWLYVMACGIKYPFNAGPWRVVDGHLRKVGRGDAGHGIIRSLPHLGPARGILREEALQSYMQQLAERLQRVRISCGSWERVTGKSVICAGYQWKDCAVFLDPPYATSGDLYAESSEGVAEEVRAWCEGVRRDLRVILCGYDSEHDALLARGWSVIEGKSGSGNGYSTDRWNGRRERLWLSPACIGSHQPGLLELLGDVDCDS